WRAPTMATKHHTSKTLKTTTARKSARPAKPKPPGDVVSVLLAQQRRLLHSMSVCGEKAKRAEKSGNQNEGAWFRRMETAAFDRASLALDELSYHCPKTNEGAAFMLAAAYATLSTVDSFTDANMRERRRRRGWRLLYALLDYLIGPGGYSGWEAGD